MTENFHAVRVTRQVATFVGRHSCDVTHVTAWGVPANWLTAMKHPVHDESPIPPARYHADRCGYDPQEP